jgi:hypothetical protein
VLAFSLAVEAKLGATEKAAAELPQSKEIWAVRVLTITVHQNNI